MAVYDIIKGALFLVLVVIGLPGNLLIMTIFSLILVSGSKLLLTEIMIAGIALVNFILIITRGLPATLLVLFNLNNLYGDTGCKFLIYSARISRSLAINLTCVLVCIQCITLLPPTSNLTSFKPRLPRYILAVCSLILMLNVLTEVIPFMYTVSKLNGTDVQYSFNFGYCIIAVPNAIIFFTFTFTYFFRDFTFVILMIISSVIILQILFRHRIRLSNIRNNVQSQQTAAEVRAAKVVVALVTMYVLFIGFENTIFLYQITVSTYIHRVVSDVRHFFSACYATLFPTVVIMTNIRIKHALKCVFKGNQSSC
ncbi:olfactory receptor class A-like protein 1 [Protopterus annectens]|uniref:olfactory receptor class A-like protein 1 n=1 Tax=Protopterus annectens TaxID=7888 RepID=UPI001CFA1591|nr:olfactory receptor class A-like protein 1 [Protopterus annectens]